MGFPDLPLGKRMHAFGGVLRGELTESGWLAFLHAVAGEIGMNAVADHALWSYPVDGKGGNGKTIVLPITESFLALDTWPDHDGAYLFVCSCRAFETKAIDAVARRWALVMARDEGRRFYAELNLT